MKTTNTNITINGKNVGLALDVDDTQANGREFDRTAVQVAAAVTVNGTHIGAVYFQTDDDTSDLVANVLTSEIQGDASAVLYAMCFPDAVWDEDSDERAAFRAAFKPAAAVATAMHREYVSAAEEVSC